MKTRTLIKSAVLLLTIIACSNNSEQELPDDFKNQTTMKQKFAGKSASEEPNQDNTYFEEDVHAYYIENTLTKQYLLKKELVAQIEEGNDEAIEQLEQLQQEIKLNEQIKKYLFGVRPPKLPGFPPPPKPCDEKEINCKLPLTNIQYLLLTQNSENISVTIKTIEGETIGTNEGLFSADNFDGYPATTLVRENYSGEVVLTITKFFPFMEQEITYQVNAIIEK
ncbi:hypothetical protein WH52_04530 [Tenacibaculum holothuriorum]|uniref:Uncharacterized protein n=1 Tax=Tenacibaculum holothuriorum TaxID=1635173 RepID=A0A1Y2PES0_9FLAO|nr:hypothetical protein [Tenacibaculum holothuriorum]OSY88935.1 hypothetical protein WH52_04530 [Tenacibaculum holothuriorum]